MRHGSTISKDRTAGRISTRSHAIAGKFLVGVAESALRVRHVEPEEVVRFFIGRRAVVPAQSEIEGQLLGYLPVVLHVRCEVIEHVRLRVARSVRRTQWTGEESAYP